MTNNERTTCLVVGGGPAGMVLGLLMARAGVEVTVLEKHADFLRDFRGDTVHASTLALLDELGLGERFARIPHRLLDRMQVQLDNGSFPVADLRRLPGAHQHIALVPQWDLLDLLADAAEEEPTFTLRRNAEARELLYDGHRVAGVRYVDRETGAEHELRASVTVACDGRGSAVRAAAGLRPRSFGVPMDVWWFRLPRRDDDPPGGVGRFTRGHFCVLIDRGDYWQCAYLIRKGSDAALRAAGIEELRRRFATLLPWLGDRVDQPAVVGRRAPARRAARAAPPLGPRRAAADRRRRARDVARRRGRDQPGGAGRGRRGPGARARAGVRRDRPAVGAAQGAAPPLVADRAGPGLPAAGPPRRPRPGAPHRPGAHAGRPAPPPSAPPPPPPARHAGSAGTHRAIELRRIRPDATAAPRCGHPAAPSTGSAAAARPAWARSRPRARRRVRSRCSPGSPCCSASRRG